MKTSETTKEIFKALLEVNKNIVNILSEANNPFYKSNYADLPSVLDLAKPELSKVGLFAIQEAPFINGMVHINTRVVHSGSGEWLETELDIFPNKNDSQGIGGAITYGRRYALLSTLNMGQTDDDGNSARSAKKDKAESKLDLIKKKSEIFDLAKKAGMPKDADKLGTEKFIKTKTELELKEENYDLIINKLKDGSKTI